MAVQKKMPEVWLAYLFLTLTMVFWAGNYTIGRWANGQIPPVTLAFLRWLGASLLILPFAWPALRREWPCIKANVRILLLLGITGSGLFNTLQYLALTDTTATNAGIINSIAPILIVVLSFLINKEVLSRWQTFGVFLSTLGVLCVLSKGSLTTLTTLAFRTGDLVMLTAMAVWAVYSVWLTKRPRMSVTTFAFVLYAIAAGLNAPLSALELSQGAVVSWSPKVVAAIAYTAIFPSLLAYLFYNRGVQILGPSRASPFMHLVPLFTALFAVSFLGEQVRISHGVGFALIVAGIFFATGGTLRPQRARIKDA